MIEAEDWTPVTDWAAELRQPGFWGWWYFQAIHGDDDGWEARYAVFGEDFTSYDLDPIFGPEPERDFDIDGPQGSVLELPFPGGYGWRVHFDAGFPGAYHSPTSSRRCGWPTTSRTTCRPYCGGPRRGGSRSTWPTGGGGRRPRYPAELIPLLFFPLALLTTEAEAEDARQVVHAAWTKAGLLSPDQVDALAAGYTGYIYSDKAWVDDPEDGFYIPGVHSLRGAPGIVTRAMTKFTAALSA